MFGSIHDKLFIVFFIDFNKLEQTRSANLYCNFDRVSFFNILDILLSLCC